MYREQALNFFNESEREIIDRYTKLIHTGRPREEGSLRSEAEKLGISYETLRKRKKRERELENNNQD